MILARRYAQAFLNVYIKQITEEHCLLMKKATRSLQSHVAWQSFFDFSSLSEEQQKHMIIILLQQYDLPDFLLSLGELLCMHGRMSLFAAILDLICIFYFSYNNIESFEITSFPALTEDEVQVLIDFLHKKSGKQIRHTCIIDKQLIAGIRARSSSLLWEYSVAKKLREARHMALNGNNS